MDFNGRVAMLVEYSRGQGRDVLRVFNDDVAYESGAAIAKMFAAANMGIAGTLVPFSGIKALRRLAAAAAERYVMLPRADAKMMTVAVRTAMLGPVVGGPKERVRTHSPIPDMADVLRFMRAIWRGGKKSHWSGMDPGEWDTKGMKRLVELTRLHMVSAYNDQYWRVDWVPNTQRKDCLTRAELEAEAKQSSNTGWWTAYLMDERSAVQLAVTPCIELGLPPDGAEVAAYEAELRAEAAQKYLKLRLEDPGASPSAVYAAVGIPEEWTLVMDLMGDA